jgi:hypothetical protein
MPEIELVPEKACHAHDAEEVGRQLAELAKCTNGTFPPGVPPEEYCNRKPVARSPHIIPGLRQDRPREPRQTSQ